MQISTVHIVGRTSKNRSRPSAALSVNYSVKSALVCWSINVVKSVGRSTLGDVNFDNAVFDTFNMPPLHHIDYGAFVRAWKKEGTQRMGTLKGASSATGDDDSVDRSEVIRRHLSAGAGTPLYT